MSWLFRNWHLKLGALALATVLYTGFVYSGSFSEQTFPGVPVEAINQPDAAYPLTQQLGTVDVRYRLSADAASRVTVESFAVTVDLSEYDMDLAPAAQALPISVRSLTDGVDILGYTPTTVAVALDRLGQKEVPVVVDRGEVPEGLAIGTPQVSERTVVATGPESQLGRVERAVARVQIFETAIDIERQVDLVPVDVDGAEVDSVELEPATVTVEIDVRAVQT
jgi:YbbR domain-containing protein